MERDGSSDYPCFYKLMFNTLNSEKLRIPPKFVKHVLNDLDAKATLLGPSGNRCSVTVEFSGINIYLQDGWQEFMRENSLGDNEFLLFTYQGNMCFRAEVFNATGLKRSASAGRANLRKKRGRPGTAPSTPKHCKDTSGGKTRPESKMMREVLGRMFKGNKVCYRLHGFRNWKTKKTMTLERRINQNRWRQLGT